MIDGTIAVVRKASAGLLALVLIATLPAGPALSAQPAAGAVQYNVRHPGEIVRRGDSRRKVVALTLDDGPDPVYTPEVLALAREEHIRLTFFLIGEHVQAYPELAREIVAEGHAVGNHTWSHPALTELSRRQIESEIERCGEVIKKVCGVQTRLFRPPKGRLDRDTTRAAGGLDYTVALWTVGLENHRYRNPEQMAERVVRRVRPGAIILAHDGWPERRGSRQRSVEALRILVERLRAEGYEFVTVPELLAEEPAAQVSASGGPERGYVGWAKPQGWSGFPAEQ